ncbi:putative glycosyltransferase EpsF [Halopseudomonas aestusnigri]|uniref:glycosyltransferase n=1 Tax=Halopseudomonas TaxID=2901189 RepID=UPI0022B6048B|nr:MULTISPECIES: glycosyltransferase [Halopseudomonas]BDX20535.1 putative glycosyltransferase EpsF [Halopseudomonas aestusnigri]
MKDNVINVLHVVSKLDAGGVEKWIIDLAKLPTVRCNHVVLSVSGSKGVWDEKMQKGSVLHHPNFKKGKLKFIREFYALVKSGEYDVVHAHLYQFSMFLVVAAALARVPVIVSSHNDKKALRSKRYGSRLIESLRAYVSSFIFDRLATVRIAASVDAGNDLFRFGDFVVVHCGVLMNTLPASLPAKRKGPDDKIKMISIGSLTEQKNHAFLIELASELKRRGNLFFVIEVYGEGALRQNLEQMAMKMSVSDCIRFPGLTDSVLQKLIEADVFLFPSIYEGLGLAFIEAQSVGISCVVSDAIPLEADVAKECITRLPLNVSEWADALESSLSLAGPQQAYVCNSKMLASDFNILNSKIKIESIYEALC